MALGIQMLLSYSVISQQLALDIHGLQRMNHTDFGHPLTFPQGPPVDGKFPEKGNILLFFICIALKEEEKETE